MSTILRPTFSRWGRSVYETDADITLEEEQLSEWVDVLPAYTDAEIIVLHSKQPFGSKELEGLHSVRLVVTTTSGWDHMDVDYLKSKGVRCLRMPLIRRDAVVESILAMLLHHNRRQSQFVQDAHAGLWTRGSLHSILPHRIQDQRIAIVGLGVIGKRLAQILHGFGGMVFGCDPNVDVQSLEHVEAVEWIDIPTTCDVVLFACSHNDSSHKMVNSDWLMHCKDMVLINCARGKLIDFTAVMTALKVGQCSFLGLDVFPTEPFPHLNRISESPNIVFTPHSAGYHPRLAVQIRNGLLDVVQDWIDCSPLPFEL